MTTGTALWMTWESQPRNASMARELGVPFHEFSFGGPRLLRHLRALAATVRLLGRGKPDVVFAPNPSLVLTVALLALRRLFRFRLITDAHYGGVVSVTGSRTGQVLLDLTNRAADLVIVTNEAHAERVRRAGGRPFVCPDPLPLVAASAPRPPSLPTAGKAVLFVCSYDRDEPYREVFDAARLLKTEGFRVFASGAYRRVGLSSDAVPQVSLLGYVDRPTYEAYLANVDVVLDLTTWEDCLVCGAYEAMAARKPCVLSRTPTLTGLFTHGTVFTSHEPRDIARAVVAAYDRRAEFRAQIEQWLPRHAEIMRERIAALRVAAGLPPR